MLSSVITTFPPSILVLPISDKSTPVTLGTIQRSFPAI